jgi:hypothetical protein
VEEDCAAAGGKGRAGGGLVAIFHYHPAISGSALSTGGMGTVREDKAAS